MNKNIEEYEADKVQYPNLAQGSRYVTSGLSFMFRSQTKLRLGDYVEVQGSNFSVDNIGMQRGGMGTKDAFIYTCSNSSRRGLAESEDFDIRKFNRQKVNIITDLETIKNIKKTANYC